MYAYQQNLFRQAYDRAVGKILNTTTSLETVVKFFLSCNSCHEILIDEWLRRRFHGLFFEPTYNKRAAILPPQKNSRTSSLLEHFFLHHKNRFNFNSPREIRVSMCLMLLLENKDSPYISGFMVGRKGANFPASWSPPPKHRSFPNFHRGFHTLLSWYPRYSK